MYALPKALAEQNCDVKVIVPLYRCIPQQYKEKMVYRGSFGMAAELGHLPMVPDGDTCGCGLRGCAERYTSGSALERFAKSAVRRRPQDAERLMELCGGDAAAIALADGTYTIEVGFEGGSGKSHVLTPCTLKVENGAATATIVWSSEKYDYMLVDGQRYDVLTTEGGSTFEIPVRALDTPLTVIGDTTAMSTPHEIEYTLTFDSTTAVEAAQ